MGRALLDRSELNFLTFLKLIGVTLLKKYIPKEGSFWNHTHMNSSNIEDIKKTLNHAKKYYKECLWHLLFITIVLILVKLEGDITLIQLLEVWAVFLLGYSYILLLQCYNVTYARGTLRYLESLEIASAPGPMPDFHICIFKLGENIYHAQFTDIIIGPYFANKIDCKYFAKYIEHIYGFDDIGSDETRLTKFYEDLEEELVDRLYTAFKNRFMERNDDLIDDELLDLFSEYLTEYEDDS